jgi:hypothetical protein
VRSLRLHQTEDPAPIGAGQDHATDFLREAARLRRMAASTETDELRDALIGLAGQCDATAAIILRHRNGRAAGSQIAAAPLAPARTASAVA